MAKHIVEINLTNEQEKFIKWLVRYDKAYVKKHGNNADDNINAESELACMMLNKLNEYMDYFEREGEYCG